MRDQRADSSPACPDPEQARASALVQSWMTGAADDRIDAIGNIVGRYEGSRPGLPALVLGSHPIPSAMRQV